jgi:hypothetical protein
MVGITCTYVMQNHSMAVFIRSRSGFVSFLDVSHDFL